VMCLSQMRREHGLRRSRHIGVPLRLEVGTPAAQGAYDYDSLLDSGGFKLEGLAATDQERLHFYVGSNFHRPTSETRARLQGGGGVKRR